MRTGSLRPRTVTANEIAFSAWMLSDRSIMTQAVLQDDYVAGKFSEPFPGSRFILAAGGRPALSNPGGRPVFGDCWIDGSDVLICMGDDEDFSYSVMERNGARKIVESAGNVLRVPQAFFSGTYPVLTARSPIPDIDIVNGNLTVQTRVKILRHVDDVVSQLRHNSVAFDATAASSVPNSASLTFAGPTIAGSPDTMAAVGVAWPSTTPVISTITHNGDALSLITGAAIDTGSRVSEIWYRLAPATSGNVVVTMDQSTGALIAGINSFTGVHQTTPFGTAATASGSSTAPSVTVTATSDGMVMDNMQFGVATATAEAKQTMRWDLTPGVQRGASSTQLGSDGGVMDWSLSASVGWATVAVPILASAASLTLDMWKPQHPDFINPKMEIIGY